eukprot:gnl/TRDRNA2_/TRDRNA2_125784_c0_seq2.p1 gnl/TRDRNA2_/TRDRNA2_125784_c0~~gnl/TRDRNA2_/TRDRNA2_125784_c0_seq2.p1  ORF type:complete len:211 (-),score=22.76 gnl/TRDRNA2_/TRDRNA2_125784_c0_seq2:228-788(-)
MTDLDVCLEQWRAANGWPVSDESCRKLAVRLDDSDFRMADARLINVAGGTGESGSTLVPLQFLYPGAPCSQSDRFLAAFKAAMEEYFQSRRVTEFRSQLAKRQQEEGLRRRGGKAATEVEGGSETEENWRNYLHGPVSDPELQVHGALESQGALGRRALTCQASMSVWAAQEPVWNWAAWHFLTSS